MKNKAGIDYKILLGSILFCLIFVCLQVLAFVNLLSFAITTYIPYLVTFVVIIIATKLPFTSGKYKVPRTLFVLSVVGAFLSMLSGNGLGDAILKVIYALMGYVGYLYVSEKKIYLNLFPIILTIFYYYFYSVFFYDDSNFRVANFFGLSSSNAIAISLNGVFYFYYLLHKYYKKTGPILLLIFSVANLYFIWIQGSRIGVVVAVIFVLLSFYEFFNGKRISRRLLTIFYLLIIIISVVAVFSVYSSIFDTFVEDNGAVGVDAYEADGRSDSVLSFFSNMTVDRFLFGYDISFTFAYDLHRTFNSFLDFWSRYTLIPFVYLLIQLVRRVIRRKEYELPLYTLIPFFLYGMVETVWSGALWDSMLYFSCFLSDRSLSTHKQSKE